MKVSYHLFFLFRITYSAFCLFELVCFAHFFLLNIVAAYFVITFAMSPWAKKRNLYLKFDFFMAFLQKALCQCLFHDVSTCFRYFLHRPDHLTKNASTIFRKKTSRKEFVSNHRRHEYKWTCLFLMMAVQWKTKNFFCSFCFY